MSLSLFVVLLTNIGPFTVFSVETTMFVLKGQDVRVDLKNPVHLEDTDSIIWNFNISEKNIVKYTMGFSPPTRYFPDFYKNKVELLEGNFSLILKDLQQADSGLYSAKLSTTEDIILASYLIMIQDRVDPPVLTVDSNISNVDSCTVNVTCRTSQGSSVSSSCDSSTCSQGGGVRGGGVASAAPLHVYVSGGFIICNHSNQVSWEKDAKEISPLCPPNLSAPPAGLSLSMLKIVLYSVCLVSMVSAVLTVHIREKLAKKD